MKIHRSFLVLSAVSLLSGAVGFTLSGQIASAQQSNMPQNAQQPGRPMGGQQGGPMGGQPGGPMGGQQGGPMSGQQGGPGGGCQGGGHRRPDLEAAAKQLGITKDKLVQALGLPEKPPTDDQGRPSGPPPRPDLNAAAQRLGITEAQLVKALGIPARPQGQGPNGQQGGQNAPSNLQ